MTQNRSINATPATVWAVISEPAMHQVLDSRCRLASTSGTFGAIGSTYELTVRYGMKSARLQYVIVDALPAQKLVAEVTRNGKWAAEQRAEIIPTADKVRLRWTVSVPASGP